MRRSSCFIYRRCVLLSGVALSAILVTAPLAAATCVPTAQVFSVPSASFATTDGGSIQVTATGRILAVGGDCPATRIDNAGTISDPSIAGTSAVRVGSVTVDTVVNTGVIAGRLIGIDNQGTIQTLSNAATLLPGDIFLRSIALVNGGVLQNLRNTGTIQGSDFAVLNNGTLERLSNEGVISNDRPNAIFNSGTITLLDNGGTVTAAGTSFAGFFLGGVALQNVGVIDRLVNRGSMTGEANVPLGGGQAIVNRGMIGELLNQGLVVGYSPRGAAIGIGLTNEGTVTILRNTGTIARINNNGFIGTLANDGTVTSMINNGVTQGHTALSNAGSIGTLAVTGAINGVAGAFFHNGQLLGGGTGLSNVGSIALLDNAGRIVGSGINDFGGETTGVGTGVHNAGTIDRFRNSGLVGTGFVGFDNSGTVSAVTNTGTIEGFYGLFSSGTIVRLENSGTILGLIALRNAGTIDTLTNSGQIGRRTTYSSDFGDISNSGTIDRLENRGIIQALGNSGQIGQLVNSSTILDMGNLGLINDLSNTGLLVIGSASGQSAGLRNMVSNTGTGTVIRLFNDGTISGMGVTAGSGVINDGVIRRLENNGSILGVTAIRNNGSIGTLAVAGEIKGAAGVLFRTGVLLGGGTGLSNYGSIALLDNAGRIVTSGSAIAGGPEIAGVGDAVVNAGMIERFRNTGLVGTGASGFYNAGTVSAFTNAGTIDGFTALWNTGTIVRLENSGTIQGVRALDNGGTIGTLTNTGRINGRTTNGFSFAGISNSGTIARLENSGIIESLGGTGPIGQLINSGTIGPSRIDASTGALTAIYVHSAPQEIVNTGVIRGGITVAAGALAIAGRAGALGVLEGGTMTVPDGDVLFMAGGQVLRNAIVSRAGAGSVINAATLVVTSPVTITGNYIQPASGSLVISGTGRLAVTGTASLTATTLDLRALGASLGLGQATTVITAEGGVGGSLASLLADPAAGIRYDAVFSTGAVSILGTPASYGDLSLLGVPTSAAASAAGAALDAVRPPPGMAMTAAQVAAFGPLAAVPATLIAPTLDQLGPSIYADGLSVNRATFRMVTARVAERQAAWRDGGDGSRSAEVWMDGTGQFLRLNSSTTGPGYSASNGGFMAGADTVPVAGLLVGAVVGFTSQSVTATNAASWKGDAVQMQLYAGLRAGAWFVDGQLGGAFTEGTARRPVNAYAVTATASLPGTGAGAALRGGIRLDADGWAVEPSLGMNGLLMQQGSAVETQGGPVGLAVGGARYGGAQAVAAVRISRKIALTDTMVLEPDLRLGAAYELGPAQARVSAGFATLGGPVFTVSTPSSGRGSLVAGLRATLDTGTPLLVFAGFDAAVMRNASAQAVTGGLSWTW